MDRRDFLSLTAGVALTPLLARIASAQTATAPSPASAPASRPNFIFICTDDQRWDALSCVQNEQGDHARFPWFKTPAMDRLASEGLRFRNAFVVNSLCSPSRACFLTGQYNHTNGVTNNHTPFPQDALTHAALLRAAGYKTGYFGKWHHGDQAGSRPGFDVSISYVGQGIYNDCPFEINGKSTPTKGWVDDVATNFAIDFIKENKARPFSIVLGFKSPHGPFSPPERFRRLFDDEVAKPAVNANAKAAFIPQLGASLLEPRTGANSQPAAGDPRPAATPDTRPAEERRRDYFRTIAAADDALGRLLDALDELKLTENTVVIFTSDNGYYQGEHGLGDKRSAYDESLRIPFLVRYPKLAPRAQTRDQMILNIDLAPTLLDLAGVPIPPTMQGKSFKSLLNANPAEFRDAFLYEYFYETRYVTPTILALRTTDAKLVTYPGHDEWTEVFDLKKDPFEQQNLAGDPAARTLRQRLEAELQRQSKSLNYRVPDDADKPASKPKG